jgi:hypothetical protein
MFPGGCSVVSFVLQSSDASDTPTPLANIDSPVVVSHGSSSVFGSGVSLEGGGGGVPPGGWPPVGPPGSVTGPG